MMERLAVMPSSTMTLRFVCPSSSQELECRVPGDFKSLAKRWSKPVSLHCPHCGFDHRFLFREGYPGGVLAGFGCADSGYSITDLLAGAGDGIDAHGARADQSSIAKQALAGRSRARRTSGP
jgi:hypothetical protein